MSVTVTQHKLENNKIEIISNYIPDPHFPSRHGESIHSSIFRPQQSVHTWIRIVLWTTAQRAPSWRATSTRTRWITSACWWSSVTRMAPTKETRASSNSSTPPHTEGPTCCSATQHSVWPKALTSSSTNIWMSNALPTKPPKSRVVKLRQNHPPHPHPHPDIPPLQPVVDLLWKPTWSCWLPWRLWPCWRGHVTQLHSVNFRRHEVLDWEMCTLTEQN